MNIKLFKKKRQVSPEGSKLPGVPTCLPPALHQAQKGAGRSITGLHETVITP